jgi:prevent-host-death family protein
MAEQERVGVRELRQNLSRWLRRVERGQTFEVTERGRPVALLTPLPSTPTGALARLAAAGRLAQPATEPLETLRPPRPRRGEEGSLSEALDAVREDRL